MSRKVQSSHGYSVQYVSFTMQLLQSGGCLTPCRLLLGESGVERCCTPRRVRRVRRGSRMVAHAEAAAAAALSLTPRLTPRPTVRADRASLAPKLTPRPPVVALSPRHQPLCPRHQQPAAAVPPTASTLSPRLAYVSRNSTPEITLVTPRDRSLATAAALESSAPFEFLRGEGAELLADELRAGGLAYLREEALCDVELRTRFPNPFCLLPVSTSQAPRLRLSLIHI